MVQRTAWCTRLHCQAVTRYMITDYSHPCLLSGSQGGPLLNALRDIVPLYQLYPNLGHAVDVDRDVNIADGFGGADPIDSGDKILMYREAWCVLCNEGTIGKTQIGTVVQKCACLFGL